MNHISCVLRSLTDSNIKIDGYNVERSDRDSKNIAISKEHGGGLLIYVKESLSYRRRSDLESNNMETIWIELCPTNGTPHIICLAYRTPDYSLSTWVNNFDKQLSDAYIECHNMTVLGDFNVDILIDSYESRLWLGTMEDYNLSQVITEPTRITQDSSTLVDHVFTSEPSKIRSTSVKKIGLSDHYPTCVVIKNSFGIKHSHTKIKYRCYKHFDETSFIKDLNDGPWHITSTFDDVDECLDTWYKLFTSIIDQHLPWKERRVKLKQQPK